MDSKIALLTILLAGQLVKANDQGVPKISENQDRELVEAVIDKSDVETLLSSGILKLNEDGTLKLDLDVIKKKGIQIDFDRVAGGSICAGPAAGRVGK